MCACTAIHGESRRFPINSSVFAVNPSILRRFLAAFGGGSPQIPLQGTESQQCQLRSTLCGRRCWPPQFPRGVSSPPVSLSWLLRLLRWCKLSFFYFRGMWIEHFTASYLFSLYLLLEYEKLYILAELSDLFKFGVMDGCMCICRLILFRLRKPCEFCIIMFSIANLEKMVIECDILRGNTLYIHLFLLINSSFQVS